MHNRFFAKTDRTIKTRFFNPVQGISTSETTTSSTGQNETSIRTQIISPENLSYRAYRFLPPKKSIEQMLEDLLKNAAEAGPESCEKYLEQMLILLKKNPNLVNYHPKKFHSNPLELAITLGRMEVVKELLEMKADVRPHNRNLLNKIQRLLKAFENEKQAACKFKK